MNQLSPDLSVRVGPLRLKNPILTASGTFGYGKELIGQLDLNKLGGIVTKTITLKPRIGNPPPRIAETAAGIVNSIGLENPGLERFEKEYLPALKKLKTIRIVSIGGDKPEEIPVLARRLNRQNGIDAIEVNISCPNLKGKPTRLTVPDPVGSGRGGQVCQSVSATRELIRKVRRQTPLPLIVKLGPNVNNIVAIARSAHRAGADIIALINTFPALVVDWQTRKPFLGNITGGLSGPAIKPIALKMVWEVASKVKVPVIGMGGVISGSDVLEFLTAGASAVAIGSAHLVEPTASLRILEELEQLLKSHSIPAVREIIGSLQC